MVQANIQLLKKHNFSNYYLAKSVCIAGLCNVYRLMVGMLMHILITNTSVHFKQ